MSFISLLFQETLIVSHQHLVFKLSYRIQRNADSDQEGRAAEVDALERRYHHTDNGRQSRDQRQENRADDRNSRHHFVQIVFSCLARSDARDKAAVRFHVIRNFIRVESNARVEVCEEDDQDYV